MTINLVDRSNYFKGLLIMIGKDRLINEKEIQIVKKFGQIFDFDESFVMESINDLLSNKFISEKPFNFESSEIAKCFIKDSVTLILSDNSIDRKEYKWLLEIACSNNIEAGYCADILRKKKLDNDESQDIVKLEIEKLITNVP